MHVAQLRRHHGLLDRYARLRAEAHVDCRRVGAGIARDALWEDVTMIVDPVSFLLKR